MTGRERYLKTLLFQTPDRVPLDPGFGRRSTREAWYAQGLPRDVQNIPEFAYRQAGGTLPWPQSGEDFPVDFRMRPQYEEKVISRGERTQVVQDWKGNVCEISNEFTTEHLRNAIDFVTRRWIKCPVEGWPDWQDMKRRYDPDDSGRLPADAAALGARLADRAHVVKFYISGPFWQLREWMGFEGLCTAFYDAPDLVSEMLAVWEDFVTRTLENAFRYIIPDEIHISEDMAYKGRSMISPAMVRERLLPVWTRWGRVIRGAGVPIYAVDSDGCVDELIPFWIEAGLNACDPMEVAAGNDIVAFRKRFGRDIAYRGGIDKRAMARGGKALADEVLRVEPVIRDGGYIPSCDHGVPPDVSWANYVETARLLAKATGWL